MNDAKSTLSAAQTNQEMGSFWDTHDLSDYWAQTKPSAFEVEGKSQAIYYPIETQLARQLRTKAAERGISAETLLNLWLQEKMQETPAQ